MKKYLLIFLAINVTSYAMNTRDYDVHENASYKSKINFILNNSSTNTDSSTDSDTDLETNSSEEDTFSIFLSQYAPKQLSTLSDQNCPPYIHPIEPEKKTSKKDLPNEDFDKLLKKHGTKQVTNLYSSISNNSKTETNEEENCVFHVTCPYIGKPKKKSNKNCVYKHFRTCPPSFLPTIIQRLREHLGTEHGILKSDSNYSYLTNEFLLQYIHTK